MDGVGSLGEVTLGEGPDGVLFITTAGVTASAGSAVAAVSVSTGAESTTAAAAPSKTVAPTEVGVGSTASAAAPSKTVTLTEVGASGTARAQGPAVSGVLTGSSASITASSGAAVANVAPVLPGAGGTARAQGPAEAIDFISSTAVVTTGAAAGANAVPVLPGAGGNTSVGVVLIAPTIPLVGGIASTGVPDLQAGIDFSFIGAAAAAGAGETTYEDGSIILGAKVDISASSADLPEVDFVDRPTGVSPWIDQTASDGSFFGATNRHDLAGSFDLEKLVCVLRQSPGGGLFGKVIISGDYGVTWNESTGIGTFQFYRTCCSNNGQVILVSAVNDALFLSTDGGVNWTVTTGPPTAVVDCTPDGMTMVAGENDPGGQVWVSTDQGVTWNQAAAGPVNIRRIVCSADGQTIYAGEVSGYLWRSRNGGSSWTQLFTDAVRPWNMLACSDDGLTVVAGVNGAPADTGIWLSLDGGNSWSLQDPNAGVGGWNDANMTPDGNTIFVSAGNAARPTASAYISKDHGVSWTRTIGPISSGIGLTHPVVSNDGNRLAINFEIGDVWTKAPDVVSVSVLATTAAGSVTSETIAVSSATLATYATPLSENVVFSDTGAGVTALANGVSEVDVGAFGPSVTSNSGEFVQQIGAFPLTFGVTTNAAAQGISEELNFTGIQAGSAAAAEGGAISLSFLGGAQTSTFGQDLFVKPSIDAMGVAGVTASATSFESIVVAGFSGARANTRAGTARDTDGAVPAGVNLTTQAGLDLLDFSTMSSTALVVAIAANMRVTRSTLDSEGPVVTTAGAALADSISQLIEQGLTVSAGLAAEVKQLFPAANTIAGAGTTGVLERTFITGAPVVISTTVSAADNDNVPGTYVTTGSNGFTGSFAYPQNPSGVQIVTSAGEGPGISRSIMGPSVGASAGDFMSTWMPLSAGVRTAIGQFEFITVESPTVSVRIVVNILTGAADVVVLSPAADTNVLSSENQVGIETPDVRTMIEIGDVA